jgi:S1-C subfamily serine protease
LLMQQDPRRSKVRKRPRANRPWQKALRPIALLLFWLAERLILVLEPLLAHGSAKISQLRRRHKAMLIMLVIWVVGGLFVLHQSGQLPFSGDKSDFEIAYPSIVQLGETALEASPPVLRSQSNYGISQTLYDRWRQSQNLPPQAIAALSGAEAKALYQQFWQRGNCGRYAPPLEVACLDTQISFDPELSRSFLADLPADPKAAAIAVANRRSIYHRRILSSLTPDLSVNAVPNEELRQNRLTQIEGLQRDRALIGLAETGVSIITSQAPDSLQPPDQGLPRDFRFPFDRSPADSQLAKLSVSQIYAKAEPFTAEVWIKLEDGTHAPATGIVLSADGLILTNAHVVENNANPTIHLRSSAFRNDEQVEQKYPGRAIAVDRQFDLALVQASGASNLTVAPFAATTAQVKPGDTVYAIGSPEGAHWKLTQTKVIAVQSPCGLPNLKCIRSPKGFLEPGNSGGPLLDQAGTVIGINRALQESTGEGVSIPVEVIQEFLEKVKR